MAPHPLRVDTQEPCGIACRCGCTALLPSSEPTFPLARMTALTVPLLSKWPFPCRPFGFHSEDPVPGDRHHMLLHFLPTQMPASQNCLTKPLPENYFIQTDVQGHGTLGSTDTADPESGTHYVCIINLAVDLCACVSLSPKCLLSRGKISSLIFPSYSRAVTVPSDILLDFAISGFPAYFYLLRLPPYARGFSRLQRPLCPCADLAGNAGSNDLKKWYTGALDASPGWSSSVLAPAFPAGLDCGCPGDSTHDKPPWLSSLPCHAFPTLRLGFLGLPLKLLPLDSLFRVWGN